jgi:hypothetical protein
MTRMLLSRHSLLIELNDHQRDVVAAPGIVGLSEQLLAATSGTGSAPSVAAIASLVTISVNPSEHSSKRSAA